MKRTQIQSDRRNIDAVVVESFGSLTTYTIFYKTGKKRKYNAPTQSMRSRFDWWYRRFDSDDSPIEYSCAGRVVVLLPRYDTDIPDSVYTYFPFLHKVESEGFIL